MKKWIKRVAIILGFLSWSFLLLTWGTIARASAHNPDFGFVIEQALLAFVEILKFLNEMAQLVW